MLKKDYLSSLKKIICCLLQFPIKNIFLKVFKLLVVLKNAFCFTFCLTIINKLIQRLIYNKDS